MAKKPTKFQDLTKDELIRSAIEDFAIELDEDERGSKSNVLAAFVESSIFWDDYVAQHPEVAPEPEAPAVVTSNAPTHGVVGEDTVKGTLANSQEVDEPVASEVPRTALPTQAPDEYILKMTRENELYQTRGYTWTSEHPYALVSSADAQWILENEDGFRQAFPQELSEFYG